jgi:heme exporter protein C
VQFLVWLGYVLIQHAAEEDERRPRFAAVFAIVALCTLPLTHFSVQWFGGVSHPEQVAQKDPRASATLGAAMLAFLLLYTLLYRWKYDLDTAAARAAAALGRVRRLEEAR